MTLNDITEILIQADQLEAQRQLMDACELLETAMDHHPDDYRLFARYSEACKNLGDTTGALPDLERALELAPPEVKPLLHSRLVLLRWTLAQTQAEAETELIRYQEAYASAQPKQLPLNKPDPNRQLRIGYLSPDFRLCSAALLLEMLFLEHDDEHEIFAYSLVESPWDPAQQQFKKLIPNWRNLSGLSNQAATDLIKADQIDILVDLAGHTSLSPLPILIQQAAPIQITGLTFNGPVGLTQLPWRLSDSIVSPEPSLGESLLMLDSWIWWPEPYDAQLLPGRNPEQLPQIAQRLGCAHHPGRLSPQTIALWSRLLQSLPQASLQLKHRLYEDPGCRMQIAQAFAQHGIGYERLGFHGGSGYRDYLRFYQNLDLVLDPFPYHGGLVSCEALWMGVPIVTLSEWTRGGESLLRQVGWEPGIAHNEAEYFAHALALAQNLPLRREAALTLRQRLYQSSVMRGDILSQQLHQHYRRLWQQACAGAHST